jgi:hypothetical protein
MKSFVTLIFTTVVLALLFSLTLLATSTSPSPLARQLFGHGNRAHAPGFFNVEKSSSGSSESSDNPFATSESSSRVRQRSKKTIFFSHHHEKKNDFFSFRFFFFFSSLTHCFRSGWF